MSETHLGMLPRAGRKRNNVTLDVKIEVIKQSRSGDRAIDIARRLALPPTTVRSIIKNAGEIMSKAQYTTQHSTVKITRQRSGVIEKMERLLSMWLEDLHKQNTPVSFVHIQKKAISLYDFVKSEGECSAAPNETFSASRGWFKRFQTRYGFNNVKLQGEAANADTEAAYAFLQTMSRFIEEEGYDPRQVFNIGETGLYWKRMPSKSYISINEKSAPGFKASKDRLTLLLGGNANGGKKLRPLLVYHSETPRAMKNFAKSLLPVIWKSQKKAWITKQIFRDWFLECLVPELKLYCQQENLLFKILLLLDNAPAYDIDFEALCPNIKVVFLPPLTTSLILPMEQGVIANFKAYYLRRIFRKVISETGEGKLSVQEFWKCFNIRDAVYIISEAWNEVAVSCMNSVWMSIYPEAVHDFTCFENSEEIHGELASLARNLFDNVKEDDIKELLESHSQPLTNEELAELNKQAFDGQAIVNKKSSLIEESGLTANHLRNVFNLADELTGILQSFDHLPDRAAKVTRLINDSLSCYRVIYDAKNHHSNQMKLDSSFTRNFRELQQSVTETEGTSAIVAPALNAEKKLNSEIEGCRTNGENLFSLLKVKSENETLSSHESMEEISMMNAVSIKSEMEIEGKYFCESQHKNYGLNNYEKRNEPDLETNSEIKANRSQDIQKTEDVLNCVSIKQEEDETICVGDGIIDIGSFITQCESDKFDPQ